MDHRVFDNLARSFGSTASRRLAARALAGGACATVLGRLGLGAAEAAKCAVVGKPCKRGKQCCSGRCKGPKGQEKCRSGGHAGTCQPGQDSCAQTGEVFCNGTFDCVCHVTTSGANFCGNRFEGACAVCSTDAYCRSVTGPGSACVRLAGTAACPGCADTGTFCQLPCPRR